MTTTIRSVTILGEAIRPGFLIVADHSMVRNAKLPEIRGRQDEPRCLPFGARHRTVKTADGGKDLAIFQKRPKIILDSLWALPDFTMHSLSDPENSY
jgi:hypothetical protein